MAGYDILSPVTVAILQFKASYTISEITFSVRRGIALAFARVIGHSELAGSIILNFTEVSIFRRQQRGVLVDVGMLASDFWDSAAEFTSRLTESNINAQMLSLGLRSVQIVQNSSIINWSPMSKPGEKTTPDKLENERGTYSTPMTIIVGFVVGSLLLIALSAGLLHWYWRRARKQLKTHVSKGS